MANEIVVSGTLRYEDATGAEDNLDFADLSATLLFTRFNKCIHFVGTTEEAMKLGEVVTPGWCLIKNLDATNYVEIRTGTGGTKMLKIAAGKSAGPFYFGSGVTAPYIIADTAEVKVVYLITST